MADFPGFTPEHIANNLVIQGRNVPRVGGFGFMPQRLFVLKNHSASSFLLETNVTLLAEVREIELKKCPRCEELLPLSEFGVCRARKDGLNLYCKRCIRQKIALSRQALREYKKARVKHGSSTTDRSRLTIDTKSVFSSRRIARMLRKLSPADRVREAIRCGAHTQKEIAQVTKLPKDEVCDALANLLLWTREIRTQIVRHQRMYFVNEALDELATVQAVAKRQRSLNPSFSSVGVLMPGRKPSAKGKKRSTKPAAKSKSAAG
jgi:hypothetical protein